VYSQDFTFDFDSNTSFSSFRPSQSHILSFLVEDIDERSSLEVVEINGGRGGYLSGEGKVLVGVIRRFWLSSDERRSDFFGETTNHQKNHQQEQTLFERN